MIDMEPKKKKNTIKERRQIILIGFAIIGLAFLFVSILLISPLFFQRDTNAFNQTTTHLAPIPNTAVMTFLAQTDIAATAQVSMTSTPLP
jgi:hypothetical protein